MSVAYSPGLLHMWEVWVEFKLQYKRVFYVSACVKFLLVLLATANHMAKPRLNVEVTIEGIDTAGSGSSSGRGYSDNFQSFNRNLLCCYAHDLQILSPPKLLLFKILGTMMGFATCISQCSLDHLVALMEFTSVTKSFSLVPLDLIWFSPCHSISLYWWGSVVVSMIALEF